MWACRYPTTGYIIMLYYPMPSIIKDTFFALYSFIRRFTWELYKASQFQAIEMDINMQTKGYSLTKRIIIWSVVFVVVTTILLVVLRFLGELLLLATAPVSDSIESIQ